MADERCAHPGDDEPSGDPAARRRPGRWLDGRTAERLLDGDAPDNAVAPAHRDEAERLARTLNALAALSDPPVPPDEELPGEASALAAFRKIHADRTTPTTAYVDSRDPSADAAVLAFRAARAEQGGASGAQGAPAPDDGADAQVVRIGAGRPERTPSRRGRTVRLGAAAALAVGMAGGVAAATGVGGFPAPFDAAEPAPVTSVSAAATPGPPLPLDSPSPALSPSPAPGAGHGGRAGPDTPGGTASGGPAAPSAGGKAKGDGDGGGPGVGNRRAWPSGVPAACRDLRDGKILNQQRRRSLESAAGGVWRVPVYCAHVLTTPDGPSGTDTGTQKPGGQGRTGGHGQNGWGGQYGGPGGDGAGWGGGKPGLGDGHGHGPDHGRHHGRGGKGDRGADGEDGGQGGQGDGAGNAGGNGGD
ncbi:hypothetical protein [Streptomyces sp. NPDC101166]|uniref:hypothetical protein n=1 Tax=Streptomyces sp. NPDC101166 TaxID=3366120 RepID=UPI0037F34854